MPLYQRHTAMVFMLFSKKWVSAVELQRQTETRNYDTVWSLMHRIRRAMRDRDSLYSLKDMQELDEGFIMTATQSEGRDNLK
jgi:hypothetical protein